MLIVETFVIHKRFHGLVQRASRWSKRNAERANKIPVVRGLIARSSAVVALLTRRAPRNFPLSNGRSPTVTIGRSKTVCLPRRVPPSHDDTCRLRRPQAAFVPGMFNRWPTACSSIGALAQSDRDRLYLAPG